MASAPRRVFHLTLPNLARLDQQQSETGMPDLPQGKKRSVDEASESSSLPWDDGDRWDKMAALDDADQYPYNPQSTPPPTHTRTVRRSVPTLNCGVHSRQSFLPGPTQLAHCAAVHIAEAVAFGSEFWLYGSGGEPFIVFMVMLNAIFFLFTAVAVRGI